MKLAGLHYYEARMCVETAAEILRDPLEDHELAERAEALARELAEAERLADAAAMGPEEVEEAFLKEGREVLGDFLARK